MAALETRLLLSLQAHGIKGYGTSVRVMDHFTDLFLEKAIQLKLTAANIKK